MIKFDFSTYNDLNILDSYKEKMESALNTLSLKESMLDWFDFETTVSNEELLKIKTYANYIKENFDTMIVIGIGGSYLGAKAIIDIFSPYFKKSDIEILYAGNNLSSEYMVELLDYIKDKNVCINVISKSGTTLEPSIAFELLMNYLKENYSDEEIKNRVYITTDENKGTLRELVNNNGYNSLVVPDNIGGRYSCMTAVGLLPMAVSGINIDELIKGYKEGKALIPKALEYASIRDYLYNNGKKIEAYTIYEPKLYYFTEWLKQLFGETQGKENLGIMPISIVNSRDLHSLGQHLQEGDKIFFETVIGIEESKDINTHLNYSLNEINNKALYNVCKAHQNGGSISNIIYLDKINEYNIGSLIYFFFIAASSGALMLGVDPFNQPGVQEYKALLTKSLEE